MVKYDSKVASSTRISRESLELIFKNIVAEVGHDLNTC